MDCKLVNNGASLHCAHFRRLGWLGGNLGHWWNVLPGRPMKEVIEWVQTETDQERQSLLLN